MYTILSLILLVWLVGFLTHAGGDLIHLLLVIAGAIFLFDLITGRRTV